MADFVIYSQKQKHIAETKFFNDFREANKYVSENYSEDYQAKVTEFNFNKDFQSMLKDNCQVKTLTNDYGKTCGFVDTDGILNINGYVTGNDIQMLNRSKTQYKFLSFKDFIIKHNSYCK